MTQLILDKTTIGMEQIKENFRKAFNLAVKTFNASEFKSFFKNVLPSMELLAKLMISDFKCGKDLPSDLISGDWSLNEKGDGKLSCAVSPDDLQPKNYAFGNLIKKVCQCFRHYNKGQEATALKLENHSIALLGYYNIAHEFDSPVVAVNENPELNAYACVRFFQIYIEFLKNYGVISKRLTDFLGSMERFSFELQQENTEPQKVVVENDGDGVVLPNWLDNLIFQDLSAKYCPMRTDLTVLNWNKEQVQNYLGTYFPRSFAESYSIFTNFFEKNKDDYIQQSELSVFDFGCGTGGELVGFIISVYEQLPTIKSIYIHALDGNKYALRLLESIISQTSTKTNIDIRLRLMPVIINDFYDMSVINGVITEKYDFIITFKAICEFVTEQQFAQKNPYEYILETLLPHLSDNGGFCIADISTYSDVSNEWLPKMLDAASMACNVEIVGKNTGYNEEYHISHSGKQKDRSKIVWRIYKQR